MTPRRACPVIGCARSTGRGYICGRCWRLVPAETKIAIDGHRDARDHPQAWGEPVREEADPDLHAWGAFVLFSWYAALDYAATQAGQARYGEGGW